MDYAAEYQLGDMNLVKAGVSETVRMPLHRVPWRVLVRPGSKEDLEAVLLLAAHRGVPMEERSDLFYRIGRAHETTDPDLS